MTERAGDKPLPYPQDRTSSQPTQVRHEPHVEPKRDEYGLTEAERLAGKTPCGCLYWPGCACPDPLDRKRPEPCCEEHGLRELVTELAAQPNAPAPDPEDRLREEAKALWRKVPNWDTAESPEAQEAFELIHAVLVRVVRETAEHGCKTVNEQRRALRHWVLEEKP